MSNCVSDLMEKTWLLINAVNWSLLLQEDGCSIRPNVTTVRSLLAHGIICLTEKCWCILLQIFWRDPDPDSASSFKHENQKTDFHFISMLVLYVVKRWEVSFELLCFSEAFSGSGGGPVCTLTSASTVVYHLTKKINTSWCFIQQTIDEIKSSLLYVVAVNYNTKCQLTRYHRAFYYHRMDGLCCTCLLYILLPIGFQMCLVFLMLDAWVEE